MGLVLRVPPHRGVEFQRRSTIAQFPNDRTGFPSSVFTLPDEGE